MKDLSSPRLPKALSSPSPRMLLIGFLILLLIGLVIIMVIFSNGVAVDANDTVYSDGKLKTIINYHDENPEEIWVQYVIYREDGILSREKIGKTYSYILPLKKGQNLAEYKIKLDPGTYKVFIYLSTTDPEPKRITGFIHSVDV
ncbi:MAG TPA: hypothetical protein O0X42_00285 [Methanocorpusculum sp.]|nr:hypothetical protein [Methanocorpusculum sp.]